MEPSKVIAFFSNLKHDSFANLSHSITNSMRFLGALLPFCII